MSTGDVSDPGAFRWIPTGITGLARPRRWDATSSVELPELRAEQAGELELLVFADELVGPRAVDDDVLERIAAALDTELERPYEVLAVRRTTTMWAAAGRRLNAELIRFPGVGNESLAVAIAPDGGLLRMVDGSPAGGPVDPPVADALREIEGRGRARFQAFAAHADNLDGERWKLTIDPL